MKNLYIYARNGHFYFKMKVPVALCKEFDCLMLRKSLNTKSLLEANHIANILRDRFKDLFQQARTGILSKKEIRNSVNGIFNIGIEGLKKLQAESSKANSLIGNAPKIADNGTSPFEPIIDKILSQRNNRIEKDSIEYKKLLSDTVNLFIETFQNEKRKASGSYLKLSPQSPPEKTTKRLSKLINEYVKEHITDKKWGEKTKVEFNAFFKNLIEIMGDIDINSINREKINAFKEKLLLIPANRNKNPIYRGKSIDEMLSMKNVEPMSVSRVNKNLAVISSLFKWAKRYGYISNNHAEGLQVKFKHKASDERKVYDKDDLIKIVRKLSEIDRDNCPEDFWIPLIAMLDGMRQNEICQLYTKDIVQKEGISCFDINNNHIGKKTKTRASERIVPIHPVLIKIGFLDHVKSIKDGQLWKNLKYHEFNGYAYLYQKRYSNFNRKYITQDKKKVFHSFRHTVINNLKQAGVIEQRIAELVGHATGSIDMERYGKSYNPKVLLETLKKLDYGFNIVKVLSGK